VVISHDNRLQRTVMDKEVPRHIRQRAAAEPERSVQRRTFSAEIRHFLDVDWDLAAK